jgi:hypothetical protein
MTQAELIKVAPDRVTAREYLSQARQFFADAQNDDLSNESR